MSKKLLLVLGGVAIFFILAIVGGENLLGEVASYAAAAGFSGTDLVIAVAIAYAESGGKANAIGDRNLAPTAGPSYGLWQINVGTKAHPEYQYAVDDGSIFDPQTNANFAFEVYTKAGHSFKPWATFDPRDGSTPKYLAFLGRAEGEVS